MTAITRIGFWQTGQRSGLTCHTRRIRSRQRLEGSLSGGGGETPRAADNEPPGAVAA